ncbi:type II toxin-antitoxin system VapB family antitoxin [Streptomyces sp. NPDC094448]|uniref:type II toxin-antitoxin system VapB family antitoxin n=1 Tax=Streptomyces sp. NPDC094448 TaxID=3366063 RepID=UPI00382349C3
MTVTRIEIDTELLARVLALSKARTESEAVHLALVAYINQVGRQEVAKGSRCPFERARTRGAVEHAERRHELDKRNR